MVDANTKLDSKEGISYAMEYARAHKVVLNLVHEKLAKKYGVSTDGVMFARPIPKTNIGGMCCE